MLAAFGFEALGVVVGDMYFIDPAPLAGQETPERGVRLELRIVDRVDLRRCPDRLQPPGMASRSFRIHREPTGDAGPGPSPPPFQRLGTQPPAFRPGAVSRPAVLAGRSAGRPGRRAGPGRRRHG
jgi:hypothetical protein